MSILMRRSVEFAKFSLLFVAPICATFLGCTDANTPKTTANQFRPVEDGDKKVEAKPANDTKPADTKLANANPPAENNGTDSAAPIETNADGKKEVVGPYAVKLNELRKMSSFRPKGATQEQKLESFLNNARAQIGLAKALASDPGAPDEVRHEALFTSMKGYSMLMEAEEPEARENFAAVAKQLSEEKNPEIAAVGKAQLFSLKMIDIIALKPQDGKPLIAAIEQLLESLGQHKVGFDATVRVAQVMDQIGLSEDAGKALQIISKHYAANPDAKTSLQAHGLQVSLLLKELRTVEGDTAKELNTKLVAKLEELVKLSPNEEDISSLIMQVARMFEGEKDGSNSLPLYELAEKSYGNSKIEKIAEDVKSSVANAKKRLALLSKPFEVAGVVTDGTKFDWAKYKGKVVLVDFWATWCGPCLEEMSNIRKYYDMYHDQGFEVIGVNLDDKPEDLQDFFTKQSLAWPSVVSADATELGFKNPLAVSCGVDAIPFVMLIGSDGNVLGIHVRGERLGEELAKLFKAPAEKPADEKAAPEKPAEKSAEKTEEKQASPAETK